MRTAIAAALLVAGAGMIVRAEVMTENEKYLEEARRLAKAFETEREPERLREASMALDNVQIIAEPDPKARARLRSECLIEWLTLVQTLDANRDPSFNPRNVPPRNVTPPPNRSGDQLPPGTDPALIDDPAARSEYEKAVQANRAKVEKHRVQIHFQRLNDSLPQRAEAFIQRTYTSADSDRLEVRGAIEKIIQEPRRKARLLDILKAPPRN